jgi:hypothetical protein
MELNYISITNAALLLSFLLVGLMFLLKYYQKLLEQKTVIYHGVDGSINLEGVHKKNTTVQPKNPDRYKDNYIPMFLNKKNTNKVNAFGRWKVTMKNGAEKTYLGYISDILRGHSDNILTYREIV